MSVVFSAVAVAPWPLLSRRRSAANSRERDAILTLAPAVASAALWAIGPARSAAAAASSAAFAPITLTTGVAWVAIESIIDWS